MSEERPDIGNMPDLEIVDTELRLQGEFLAHLAEQRAQLPGVDRQRLFEAWAIGKIAKYEVIVPQLIEAALKESGKLSKVLEWVEELEHRVIDLEQ